ncbi:hypothetical protein GCM10023263_38910 [Phytohabitans rumicis]
MRLGTHELAFGHGETPQGEKERKYGTLEQPRERGQLSSRTVVAHAAAAAGRLVPAGRAKPTWANMTITVAVNADASNGISVVQTRGGEPLPRLPAPVWDSRQVS